jgi:hypothetical protein
MLRIEVYAPHFSSCDNLLSPENDQGHNCDTRYPMMGENDLIMARNAGGIKGKLNCDKLPVFP